MKWSLLTAMCFLGGSVFAQANPITGFAVEPSGDGIRLTWSIRQGFSTCFDVQVQEAPAGSQDFTTVYTYAGICGGETGDITYDWQYDRPVPNAWMDYRLAVSGKPETESIRFRMLRFGSESIMIFPNPISEKSVLVVSEDLSLPLTVEVLGLQGEVEFVSEESFSREFSLKEIPFEGVCFLRITDGKGQQFVRRAIF